ncbi:MAG TPA: hypothetical protein VL651_09335 [Bacteroidia bacterium]|nr:hypothetical protein [Bacteroidia bacterium]
MNLLIADSGSTKTDWFLLLDGKELSFRTAGFNPWQMSEEEFAKEFSNEVVSKCGNKFSGEIHFYGAGCGTKEKQDSWKKVMKQCLPAATVNVHSDLLGAARALCGKEAGIVAILGTGSNSCLYDGEKIIATRPSPGYIFGDEGGGAHIGKTFLGKYLNWELSKSLSEQFERETGMNAEKILEGVYKRPHPNRFLASFAEFVTRNAAQPECAEILQNSFQTFTSKHLMLYDSRKYKVNVTGSVGIHNRDLLLSIWRTTGIKAGKFVESPIEGLKEYHAIG